MTFPSLTSMHPREFLYYSVMEFKILCLNKPETSLKDLFCHQCSSQLAPCSTAAPSPLNCPQNCTPREEAHGREENNCETPCVAIQKMSAFLLWAKGMEMLEKGRKEQLHDLLKTRWENYGYSPNSVPYATTLCLLPVNSTAGSEALSYCLLTSKCTPPLPSVEKCL